MKKALLTAAMVMGLSGAGLAVPGFAQTAGGQLAGGSAAGAPEGGGWTECQITAISVFRDRLQLACATPVTAGENAVSNFAVETQGGLWQPTLTLAVEAQGRKRPLSILYVKAGEANPAECDAKNCRRLAAAALK